MPETTPVQDFRAGLAGFINQARRGEVVEITRDGEPVAALVGLASLRQLEAAAVLLKEVQRRGAVAWKQYKHERKGAYYEGASDALDGVEMLIKGDRPALAEAQLCRICGHMLNIPANNGFRLDWCVGHEDES